MINPKQQELLLEWIDDRDEAFTTTDISTAFNVHYMTAYKWLTNLSKTGFVKKYPVRRGRSDQYVKSDEARVEVSSSQQSLKVQRGNEAMSLGFWATKNLDSADLPKIAHALTYLFVRSYYADAPDHQHLRGKIDPVAVRGYVVDKLKELKKDIEVVEQILSYRVPFTEGSVLGERFGDPPVGFSLVDAMSKAENFSKIYEAETSK